MAKAGELARKVMSGNRCVIIADETTVRLFGDRVQESFNSENLIGAFHHPSLVIIDVDALETLPAHELRKGYAEIIKHAIIRDREMFSNLSSRAPVEGSRDESFKVTHRDPSTPLRSARDDGLVAQIRRNIAIKARIVSADAREISGERALLNFGHTVGHAIERATDFKIPQGDSIVIGMVAACWISIKRAGLSSLERGDIR